VRRPSAPLRRAGWAVADQAFSSGTNFALGVLVARSVDLAAFGAFSLAFAAYLVIVSVTRAYPMDPLAIRYAAAPREAFRRGVSAATGTVLLVGVAFGIVFLAIGFVTRGPFSESLLALGITLPGLLLQDAWRSTFFAAGRGRQAFFNDVVWALVEFPALAIVIASGGRSVFWPVLAWGGGAVVAALVGVVQASVVPRPWLALSWWREHTDLGLRFIAEALARVVSGQIQLYGVGFVAGLTAVGTLRAGQLLFGPVQVVSFGISMMAVPEGARALAVSLRRLERVTLIVSTGLTVSAVGWGIVVLLLPAQLGTLLLRTAWDPAHSLAVPILIGSVGVALSYGGGIGVRTLAAAGRSLRATIVTSTLTVTLGIAGAAIAGATGSAWALSVVAIVGAVIWWYEYRGALRDHVARRIATTGAPSGPGAVAASGELS
jgi:O-antigen/teichoic acid export membrane protein